MNHPNQRKHTTIETPADLIPGVIDLNDQDGNAVMLIGNVCVALRKAGNPPRIVKIFREEAMSGDYNHVLLTCMAYTTQEEMPR